MPRVSSARHRLIVRLTLLLFALPLGGGAALTDARVRLEHGRVSIHSQSAPLAEILSRFAQATGAEVVYEAARPRQLVSVVIEAASPAEAITQLLEGQGLNYALRLDPTGRNVEMLVVSGSASAAAAPAGTSRAPRAAAPPAPEEAYEVLPENAEEPPVPDTAEAPEPGVPGDVLAPGLAVPFAGPAPGAAPGAEASSPSAPSGLPAPEPGQPQPPAVASYPGAAPIGAPPPSAPVYPGPASYPDAERRLQRAPRSAAAAVRSTIRRSVSSE